jgi:hypothetical protein
MISEASGAGVLQYNAMASVNRNRSKPAFNTKRQIGRFFRPETAERLQWMYLTDTGRPHKILYYNIILSKSYESPIIETITL